MEKKKKYTKCKIKKQKNKQKVIKNNKKYKKIPKIIKYILFLTISILIIIEEGLMNFRDLIVREECTEQSVWENLIAIPVFCFIFLFVFPILVKIIYGVFLLFC